MNHLARRGGIWWARLTVPAHLRTVAGRREFSKSTRTHELHVAKLVAAVLLADWRRQLFALQSRPMTEGVLKLIDGAPELADGGWVTLRDAVKYSGIGREYLLRKAAEGVLPLNARVQRLVGHSVPLSALNLNSPEQGTAGGYVIPHSHYMPEVAVPQIRDGVLPLTDSPDVANAVLTQGLESVVLVSFNVHDRPGEVFLPDLSDGLVVAVDQFEVRADDVNAIRARMAASLSPDAVKQAQELFRASLKPQRAEVGEMAQKLFSEALAAYATDTSGIPGQVASKTEQGQKRRGCALFMELVGDMPLHEVTPVRVREFRDKLKLVPGKANNIKKQYRRATMAETSAALHDAGENWPMMTDKARDERVLWLDQMFRWLVQQDWIKENPVAAVNGEHTQTAAERKANRQVKARRKAEGVEDDSDDRVPFTSEELQLIFGQAQYQTGNGAHIVKSNERWYPFEYWLPVIALHGGHRIKEVSQLWLDDLCQAPDGTWYFNINEVTPDKSLKNDESAPRQIPMSPVLIALGLIEYRERLRAEGYRRLFPELTCANTDAKYAKEPVRKMSKMFAGLGMVRDGSKVFHCLRANFNDAMLRVPMALLPFDNQRLVTFAQKKIFGHAAVGVDEQHYMSTAMSEKLEFVRHIKYELPNIAKFDIEAGVAAVRIALQQKKDDRRGREDMGPCNPEFYQ